jgi:DNA-binding NarL/FixJ family response regulator
MGARGENAREVREPVRILLLEMPQLLRGILEHAIQLQSGCELLRDTGRALPMMATTALPDIVILGLTAAEDATLVPALFARWPAAQVMTVMQAGDDAAVYELRPRRRALGQMSPAEIVATLHEAVDRSRELPQE